MSGPNIDLDALIVLEPQAIDVLGIHRGFDLDQIGVQNDADIVCPFQVMAIAWAEARRRRQLSGDAFQTCGVECKAIDAEMRPEVPVVDADRQFGQLGRLAVIGFEFVAPDRPAFQAEPWARFEFNRVEGAAIAGPVIGRTAEVAQPGDVERQIFVPYEFALVDFLAVDLDVEAARLEQTDIQAASRQTTCQRDTGSAGADDRGHRRKAGRPWPRSSRDKNMCGQARMQSRASVRASSQPSRMTVRPAIQSARQRVRNSSSSTSNPRAKASIRAVGSRSTNSRPRCLAIGFSGLDAKTAARTDSGEKHGCKTHCGQLTTMHRPIFRNQFRADTLDFGRVRASAGRVLTPIRDDCVASVTFLEKG